jgi:hypothetical protein
LARIPGKQRRWLTRGDPHLHVMAAAADLAVDMG